MKYLVTASLLCVALSASSQFYDVDTLYWSGPTDERINLVILGDGYQETEFGKFSDDAQDFMNSLFAESPYKEYQSYFNVVIIKVPSNESGASHPGTATDVTEPATPVEDIDNVFGSRFDAFDIHRLLVAENTSKINSVLAINFPSYDQVLILANSPHYGGSGGQFPVSSTDEAAAEIAIHEIGHSFAALRDEYYPGDVFALEAANMTKETVPSTIKWKNWLQDDGIGVYKHCCGGDADKWYRPHENCKMRFLGVPFCAVCKEATIETIHDLVSSVQSYEPLAGAPLEEQDTFKFQVDVLAPSPNTIRIEWILNGESVDKNVSNFSLVYDDLPAGANQVVVRVEDTTQMLRVDNHEAIHFTEVEWQINSITTSIDKVQERTIDISVYPNPTSDHLEVDLGDGFDEDFSISLFDEQGRAIMKKDVAARFKKSQLSLSDLPSGTYVLKFQLGKRLIASRTFVKI